MPNPDIRDMLADHLKTESFRKVVAERADLANLTARALFAPHVRTGDLERATSVSVEYFDTGYGLKGKSLFRSAFISNKHGFTKNRSGFRRGKGMRHGRNLPVRSAGYPFIVKAVYDAFTSRPIAGA